MPTRQEGVAITWRHKVYPTLALSEVDWSILQDAAPQEYFLTETISHSLMAIMAAQKWRKTWGTRNTGNHFGIYVWRCMNTTLLQNFVWDTAESTYPNMEAPSVTLLHGKYFCKCCSD